MISAAGRYKVAAEAWEFEQIHRLNYRTFVEEIPQHPPNPERSLVDAFHAENTYIVAVRDAQLLGMVALRGNRPFSLDRKLRDLDAYLPSGCSPCEVRLLAVAPEHRRGPIFHGLVNRLLECVVQEGYDLALISGTVRQLRLYAHLGFVPFGPRVGSGEALYQPMALTLAALRERGRAFSALRSAAPQNP